MANAAFTFPRHLRRLYCRFKRRGAPCGRAAIFFIYNSYCRKRRARCTLPTPLAFPLLQLIAFAFGATGDSMQPSFPWLGCSKVWP